MAERLARNGVADQVSLSSDVITTATWGAGTPSIVLLHDGLGSISLWRDVPRLLAQRTGETVLAYDRPGHGTSGPVPPGAHPRDWMSQQAGLLDELLGAVGVRSPLLVGHSDGGSIALLHAAANPGSVLAVVALAPHSYVEQRCVDAIAAMRLNPEELLAALGHHHDDARAVFDAWSLAWTSTEFRDWDIRAQLGTITAPTLVVQGLGDEYATEAMANDTAAAVGAAAKCRLLPDLGHLLHSEAPDTVVATIAEFARQAHAPSVIRTTRSTPAAPSR